jgi:MoaA/NifB/PqqE/SkfB family radical SAM enzyme
MLFLREKLPTIILSHPSSYMRIDSSTACQLRCPTCPTAEGKVKKTLGAGFTTVEMLRTMLQNAAFVNEIELSNWGEIFLNPHLPQLLQELHSRGIRAHADNGVNLNDASGAALESVVRYGLRSMTCSIDGNSQEVYATYRKRGSLDQVIRNIETINHYKKRYRSRFPILTWQFVVFEHNKHEIAAARHRARALGMHFVLKLAWDDLHGTTSFLPVQQGKAREFFGVENRNDYARHYGRPYMQREICSQLWNAVQINYDGKVLGCCVNYWGDFGNVATRGLSGAVSEPKLQYARNMLLGRSPALAEIPCSTCSHYLAMQRNGDWLTQWSIVKSRFLFYLAMRLYENPKVPFYRLMQFKALWRRYAHRIR